MIVVNKAVRTAEEAGAFVRACESDFQYRLTETVRHIVREDGVECIALSGPTCSGKTTMAAKLTKEIAAAGKRAVVLSIDDFFKEQKFSRSIEEQQDYESVDAIDLPYFASCVEKMLRGEDTPLPRYNFQTGEREKNEAYVCTPDDILIFEGIQAVYPEVTALLQPYRCKSIFISVADSILVNGTVISPEEIRLARRIVRDHKFRSSSPEFTLHLWESVRRNEEKNIYPYMNGCDYRINSLLAYEPFMIAAHLAPLLENVPIDSPYFMRAMSLLETFRCVEGMCISEELLPSDALYHEFLG